MTHQTTAYVADIAERAVRITWPDNEHGGATPPPDDWQDRAWAQEPTLHEIDEGSVSGCSILRWRDDPRSDTELLAVSLALVTGKPAPSAEPEPAAVSAAVTPPTNQTATDASETPRQWCKCPSCWGWFVEEHPGEDLDELGTDLSWWSGLPEHRDAPDSELRRMADETATDQPQRATVQHAPGKAIRCPDCRAKGYTVCLDEPAVTTVPCSGTLGTPHQPHDWEPQPGMDPVHCPGTRKPPMDPVHILGIWADDEPAAGARQDGAES